MTPAFALKKKPDAAFELLYRRHVHEVYRYTLAVLGNAADAEDVTQTTFMNAYRAMQAGDRPRKPAHWLRAIAHNVCRQRFRQAARRPREVVALDELPGAAVREDEPEGPSAADIKRALVSLPFNQRSALVMRELEGRRQAEIAAALGLSESAVEALLFRARRAMREQLESSITCGEAERAVSRQLDRRLSRAERGRLRAHLRECSDCATFARQARAQRGALKSLGAVPLPASLLSWGGGTGAAGIGTAVGVKVAAGVAAVVVAVGAGDAGIHYLAAKPSKPRSAARAETVRRSSPAPASQPFPTRPLTLAIGTHATGTVRPVPEKASRVRHAAKGRHSATGASRSVRSHGRQVRAHGRPARPRAAPVGSQRAHAKSHGKRVRAHGHTAHPRGGSAHRAHAPRAHRPPARPPTATQPAREAPARPHRNGAAAHGKQPKP